MHGFYRLKQEKDVSICWRRVTSRYKKYDAGYPMTPLATKNRRSICTRPTETKVFDKLSREVSVKHTSYNWRNAEATYLVLLTRYCSFDIQSSLFHCKIYFAWYKISVCFSFFSCVLFIFRNMYCIGFIGKYWFKSKTSTKFPNFQKSILGLKSEYI